MKVLTVKNWIFLHESGLLLFGLKTKFHVGFFMITKWNDMAILQTNKYLSAYLSVMISFCSGDKGLHMMVYFFL